MSTVTPTPMQPAWLPPVPSPALYRFTIDEYELMVLNDPRVELIDGYVVRKVPKNPPHNWTTKALLKAFERLLQPGWTWRPEQPVRIPEFDEPEPDVSILRGSDDDYKHRTPGPADVGLLIEVSETTLDRDRGKKLSAYARGGIPVYWIVNLADSQIEVYADPGQGGYQSLVIYKPGQQVPVVIDGQLLGTIAVADILP
jgi:Uma2 family endonuclease